MPVYPPVAAGHLSEASPHTYPADLLEELSFNLGKPHTYSHQCMGTERETAGDVALQVCGFIWHSTGSAI